MTLQSMAQASRLSVVLQAHGSTSWQCIQHTIVDKLIGCNGLTSAYGHAQAGRAKREADQAEEGSDAGEICGDFRFQPAISQ
jgi:hypothetical protein